MGVLKFILHTFGWLVTIILQVAISFFIILLLSIIFAGVDTTSRSGWFASLLVIWLGYVIGINLVGMAALRWVWKGVRTLPTQRFIGTAVGALIPLVVLLLIGYSVALDETGTQFYDLITNNWQPILVQASLFIAIVGYYLPGIFNQPARKPQASQ